MSRYDKDGLITGLTSDQLDAYITDALLFVPTCKLGDKSDLCVALYALYLLSGTSSTAGGGPIKRKRDGDVEVEYSTASSQGSTSGNRYLDLYNQFAKAMSRNSPMVLGFNG